MYYLEIYSGDVKNIRLRKELLKLEEKGNLKINSVTANSKYYTGFVDPIGKNVDYTVDVDLELYLYLDEYLRCELLYWKNYPFRQPDCCINGIEYRKLLYRPNGERYNDHKNYGIILKKYINYGFKNCPCCDSIFYRNHTNFSYNIINYTNEIKRFILCYFNKERLKLAQKVMNKKIGLEIESIYEYLVGEI